MAANDFVERTGVADDVDLVDIDARSLLDLHHDVHRMRRQVTPQTYIDVGRGISLRADRIDERIFRLAHEFFVVQIAFADLHKRPQRLGRQLLDLRLDFDLAEFVLHAFVDRESDIERTVIRGQLGHSRDDMKIGVSAGHIEAP